jgi:thioredoxin-like negative regulator of GroEL
MKKLTKEGFLTSVFNYEEKAEWEYQGDTPCIIDFHDDSCPPCQALEPVIEELSEHYRDRVIFFRVDVSEETVLAEELGVKNLPTLVLCPIGDKPIVYQGAASKEKLQPVIEKELLRTRAERENDTTGGTTYDQDR